MSRKSERDYFGDAVYETWRRGGNPDCVDYERSMDHRSMDDYPDEAAEAMMRRRRR